MVMCDLFEKCRFNYSVAHCNFKLRGDESDGDEKFVRDYAGQSGVDFYHTSFETTEYAKVNGISVEMAARELRYNYFNELCRSHGFDFIATAHHQDDLIETFFINLLRKTGIKGLTGIKPKSGNLIRPMLFAGRERILGHASRFKIPFREDSTNSSLAYRRNFIRHEILPRFADVNPAFRENIARSIENLKEVEEVYLSAIEKEKRKILSQYGDNFRIDIPVLLKSKFPKIVLYEILNEFRFNADIFENIFEGLGENPGKQFFSPGFRLVKGRGELIITPLEQKTTRQFYIEKGDIELFSPVEVAISVIKNENYKIPSSPLIASFDYDKLEFPLVIRKWRQGEYFQPFGLDGLKKVSDFFIDEKFSIPEKEDAWILCSGNKIAWIMGHRIDGRFKITAETKTICRLEILKFF